MDKPSENSWIQNTLAEQILQLSKENELLKEKLSQHPLKNDTKAEEIVTAPNSTDSEEIKRLRDIVKDLESQLLRYRSRWYFVVFQWLFQFVNTWFIRFPLALILLAFHITAIFSHRFFAKA